MKPLTVLLAILAFAGCRAGAQNPKPAGNGTSDEKVKAFLEKREGTWRDLNVPRVDGQELYNIIIKNGYTKALEIGTSTGYSSIWIAWALSKTGGKLITVEIDEERYREALANFREAGLESTIDARLADAHTLVPALPGPFDFVFSDADKDWYTKYFLAVEPKLASGGCFTAHNIMAGRGYGGTAEFYEYIKSLPNYETHLFSQGGGISISYKK